MKISMFFIAILFLFSCTNDVSTPEMESAEYDSTIAMSISSEALAAPGSTTRVIIQNLPNKDTNWIIITTDPAGCSIVTEELHPYKPVVEPPANNKPPTVKTGPDQTTSGTTVTLNGSGSSDPDGTIASYKWIQEVGKPVTIVSVNAVANVSGLTGGDYRFRLTVTDNHGATASDTIHVKVTGSTTPPPPPPPPPPPTAGYTLTFSTGYDTQADMLYGGNGQYGNGKISTTFYKTGPGSFYAVPANVSSGIRSEVQYTGTQQNNTEGAVEWDVYYEVVVGSNMCSIQWHPNTSGSSGAPFLQHIGGKFVWTNWKGGGNTNYPTNFTIPQGKWLHMRVEYKFGSSGYLRHWIDGVQVLNKSGIQLGDGSGQYIKVGTNGWMSTAAASRSYYDNLKIYKKN